MDRTWIAVGLEIPVELHAFRDMCTSCLADKTSAVLAVD